MNVTITERKVATDGAELNVLDAGDGPLVVLAHGFPELAYAWRHQIPALASAGYRVLAPDQRGYGRSSCPSAVEAYDVRRLTGDLVALVDDAGAEKAVFVGNDWGSMLVWQLALLAPERVAGVVGMSVPFMPRTPVPPLQLLRQIFAGQFFYMVYFQEPGVADADLGRDPATTMRRMLAGGSLEATSDPGSFFADDGRGFVDRMPDPDALPAWLTQVELDHFAGEFTRTGFTGALNWYRNLDRNWELTPELAGARVSVPSLYVGGAQDPVLMMSPPAAAEEWLDDHRGSVIVDGAGHWMPQERPGPVNTAVLDFLAEVGPYG